MRRPSLYLKFFLLFLLLIGSFSSLTMFFAFQMIRDYHVRSLTEHLKKTGIALGRQMTLPENPASEKELDRRAKTLGKELGLRITVMEKSGRVVADSLKDPKSMENHRYRQEMQSALEGLPGVSMRYSHTLKGNMLYTALPLRKEGRITGAIRLSIFLKDIRTALHGLERKILGLALAILLFSLWAAFFFTRRMIRPLRQLMIAAESVAGGDFSVRIHPAGENEFKDLAGSFNNMTDRIARLFREVSHEKEEMESILASIQEGVLALDNGDSVILANPELKKSLGLAEPEGRPFWAVFRLPELYGLIEACRKGRGSASAEVQAGTRLFFCRAVHLPLKNEVVVVFHDVTEDRKLERLKRDFIENASHELRTPLTSVRGFVETLRENRASADLDRTLEIIQRNTDRLIRIVEDLLSLSRLEAREPELNREQVDLPGLIENILPLFEDKIKRKGLKFSLEAERGLARFTADPFMMEQMFINLIDNSVKYTEKGEIRISLSARGRSLRIEAADTGIGIPAAHLSRIFERFYVVDKSRSRSSGGTGLGLSIVKHIVLLHNGIIDVQSREGEGTRFIITFPL